MKTKISIVVSLFSLLFVFTQCVQRTEIQQVEFSQESVADPHSADDNIDIGGVDGGSIINEFSETGATEVARSVTSVGIKDYEQINRTMSVLTGVPTSNERVARAYRDLSNSLPNENSVKQFGSSAQFSMFKLGSEYCDAMMEDAALYNAAFPSANMNAGLSNTQAKQNLVNDLLNRFWGQGVQDAGMEAQTRTELMALVDELMVGEDPNSASDTRKIAKGVCSSLIITLPVTMM